ncbi:hypothetical protein P3T21_006953 [Paraburkholderia sp. GAS334]|jgi:hypothetical protein
MLTRNGPPASRGVDARFRCHAPGLRIHGGEEMLAALVKYFIRERRLNLGKSTRKQQRVRY